MGVTLPPALARLDADTLDAVLALAVEIVTEPQPIEGLSPQQARIVQMLRARAGRWVTYAALSEATAPDPSNPPQPHTMSGVLCRMRKHPLREHIETVGGGRGKVGAARWING